MTKIETTRHKNIEILAIFFNIFFKKVSFSTYFSKRKFWEKLENVRLNATSKYGTVRYRTALYLTLFWETVFFCSDSIQFQILFSFFRSEFVQDS